MKKQIRLVVTLFIGVSLAIFTSCGGDQEIKEETVVDAAVEDESQESDNDYYQIPSPDEMFGFIKESGLAYNAELLNSIDNMDSYVTPQQQALNLGIYSADLAYTAAYEEFGEVIKYFATVQKISESVGISGAFDENLIARIQSNLENPDSLVMNTSDSYFAVIDFLEQNDQGNKLGIIAAAGWLETLYVVANSADYNKDKIAVERLADQKLTLDNLLAYLSKYSEDESVNEVTEKFRELEVAFDNLAEDSGESGIALKKKSDGKMVLGGGTSISISEDQFNAIKDKINEIRANIVKKEA